MEKSLKILKMYLNEAKGVRLWLDDVRPMPRGYDIHVQTVEDAIKYLKKGNVVAISFDHDLGVDKTGYDLAKWIEKKAYFGELPMLDWNIHSANPVGRDNIKYAMLNADKFWKNK